MYVSEGVLNLEQKKYIGERKQKQSSRQNVKLPGRIKLGRLKICLQMLQSCTLYYNQTDNRPDLCLIIFTIVIAITIFTKFVTNDFISSQFAPLRSSYKFIPGNTVFLHFSPQSCISLCSRATKPRLFIQLRIFCVCFYLKRSHNKKS